jgi:hypothetical protein
MALYVNGHRDGREVNDLPVRSVRAIEVYSQGAFAPTEYSIRGSCGVIVIWTDQARKTIQPLSAAKSAGSKSPKSP